MILPRPVIFALCTLLLAAPNGARAAEPLTENAIVKASKSHTGAAQAAASFQQSESMKAAQSLISHINEANANDAERAADIAPAAAPVAAPQPAFVVQNELIAPRAKMAAPRAVSAARPSLPAYNN